MRHGAKYIKQALADVASVKSGFPFRGTVPEVGSGDVLAVQMKDVDGESLSINWHELVRTRLAGRKKPEWLKDGDILLLARGSRNVAVCLRNTPSRTVCSPHFFLLQVHDEEQVLPAFLAWQINQPPAQRHFEQTATGMIQRGLRRVDVETLPLTIPPMTVQGQVASMAEAAMHEKRLLQELIRNRERQMLAVAARVLG